MKQSAWLLHFRMPVVQRGVRAGLSGIEVSCLAQCYKYMSERGHAYGALSDYNFTWMLYTDRRGKLLVSHAISCEQRSGPDCLSVTEVGNPHSWPLLGPSSACGPQNLYSMPADRPTVKYK